uniref:Uncharacterized protein n=1 Tax=Hemiselmis andersenii TaxID=464988 RepID=A0A7S1HBU1_HEMAN|mmetsp:Transcript_49915/g.121152  ORF Transcript_49915/g.121152 Transcript_49915/m.121152 type:complete len:166 (+) Transcript_49915:146-643(+)
MIDYMSSSKIWVLTGYPTGRDPRDVLLEPGVHNDSFWVLATHDMTMVFLRLEADASESEVRGMFGEGYKVDMREANEAAVVAMQVREHGERVADDAQRVEQLIAALEDRDLNDYMDELVRAVPLREALPSVERVVARVDVTVSEFSRAVPSHWMEMGISMGRWNR